MAATLFPNLFFILLVLSHVICLKAVPVTRTEKLMQDLQVHPILKNNHHKVVTEKNWHLKEPSIAKRMDLELNDYAPSGANGRHTPRGP